VRCFYINLDTATARAQHVEASFAAAAPRGRQLIRFPAVQADGAANIPGDLSPAEKGCFASHRAILAGNLGDSAALHVTEDDVRFLPRTFEVIDEILGEGPADWDILFTDYIVCDFHTLVKQARERRRLLAEGRFTLQDLTDIKFAGSTSYVVNGASKAKVFDALAKATRLDVQYDILLRRLAAAGRLKVFGVLPFITGLSEEADLSQIQAGATDFSDVLLNAQRRLLCLDGDLEASRRVAARILTDADDEARIFGALFSGLLSPDFPDHR
jgi:GR25 family glycosyltransferase involved in LPS biosynthesis